MDNNIITFSLTEKIEYCSVWLNNNNLTSNIGGRIGGDVEQSTLGGLVKRLNSKKYYIVDFCDCPGTINATEDIREDFAKENIIILATEKLKDAFLKQNLGKAEDLKESKGPENLFAIVFRDKGEFYDYFEKIRETSRDVDLSFYFHQFLLTRFFIDDIKNHPQYLFEKGKLKYLESSNVYVNKYINVKSLFLDKKYMMLVIKDLTDLVKRSFKGDMTELVLLGVSNNGIILANLLSYELKIPVQSLNRLGPVYCLDKRVDRNNQFSNKKYVLVSDVICMGGEYRMAQGIIDILGSTLLGGVCVVQIREVYRNDGEQKKESNVFALLNDINGIKVGEEQIDYQIFVDNS
jgi:orotate phosphoribosyltransferase